jgi:hypothetical protein
MHQPSLRLHQRQPEQGLVPHHSLFPRDLHGANHRPLNDPLKWPVPVELQPLLADPEPQASRLSLAYQTVNELFLFPPGSGQAGAESQTERGPEDRHFCGWTHSDQCEVEGLTALAVEDRSETSLG